MIRTTVVSRTVREIPFGIDKTDGSQFARAANPLRANEICDMVWYRTCTARYGTVPVRCHTVSPDVAYRSDFATVEVKPNAEQRAFDQALTK